MINNQSNTNYKPSPRGVGGGLPSPRGVGGGRPINYLIIHCSAVKPNQTSSAKQIDAWHKAQGYRCIGYHYVIRRNGTIETGRPEAQFGAHCLGRNHDSIGICYEGGLNSKGQPEDTRTEAQKAALLKLLKELKTRYPNAHIAGHNQFSTKLCPVFNVERELSQLNDNHK